MIIRGAAKVNRIEFALQFYKDHVRCKNLLDCNLTLNALLDSCIKCDKLELALEIFETHLD